MNGSKKISVHVLASACVMVLAWYVRTFGHVEIPTEIGIAIGTILAIVLMLVLPSDRVSDEDAATKEGGFIRLALLPLLFLMALYGCAVMEGLTSPLHKQPTAEQEAAETPGQKALRLAHATIDEANAALLSLDKVINDNFDNEVWTKAEAQDYLDQSVKFGKQLDKAREALRLGDLTGAQQQAEALRNLIITLQRQAAAGARSN